MTSNSSAVPERLPLVQGQQDSTCGSSVNRAAHRGGEDAARTAMTPQASRTCAAPANPFRAPQQKPEGQHWTVWASCIQTDPEVFFPEKGERALNAIAICESCPVRFECLEYALDEDLDTGVYGGLSSNERRPLHRAHRAALRAARDVPVVAVDVPVDRMLAARRANVKKAQQASIAARVKRAAS
jgi:WhiB family redox-sensing transcriptional regulator